VRISALSESAGQPAAATTTFTVAPAGCLRDCFLSLRIPARGHWKGAGKELVGDFIPAGAWPCKPIPTVETTAAFDGAGSGVADCASTAASEQLRQHGGIGSINSPLQAGGGGGGGGEPLLIRSKEVNRCYAAAAAAIEHPMLGPVVQRHCSAGGWKAVVLFPFVDREKLEVDRSKRNGG
jgi:hypothetical protein